MFWVSFESCLSVRVSLFGCMHAGNTSMRYLMCWAGGKSFFHKGPPFLSATTRFIHFLFFHLQHFCNHHSHEKGLILLGEKHGYHVLAEEKDSVVSG